MTDANIPDIKGEADVLKVTEKFRLDLTDEEAARFFQELTLTLTLTPTLTLTLTLTRTLTLTLTLTLNSASSRS